MEKWNASQDLRRRDADRWPDMTSVLDKPWLMNLGRSPKLVTIGYWNGTPTMKQPSCPGLTLIIHRGITPSSWYSWSSSTSSCDINCTAYRGESCSVAIYFWKMRDMFGYRLLVHVLVWSCCIFYRLKHEMMVQYWLQSVDTHRIIKHHRNRSESSNLP